MEPASKAIASRAQGVERRVAAVAKSVIDKEFPVLEKISEPAVAPDPAQSPPYQGRLDGPLPDALSPIKHCYSEMPVVALPFPGYFPKIGRPARSFTVTNTISMSTRATPARYATS